MRIVTLSIFAVLAAALSWVAIRSLPSQDTGEIVIRTSADRQGPERSEAFSVLLVTSDGAEVEIDGLVATYEIIDTVRWTECFGQTDLEGTYVIGLAGVLMRNWARWNALEALSDLPDAVPSPAQALAGESDADCGITMHAVDFDNARVRLLSPEA